MTFEQNMSKIIRHKQNQVI